MSGVTQQVLLGSLAAVGAPIGTPISLGSTSGTSSYDNVTISIVSGANIAANSLVVVFVGSQANLDSSATDPVSSITEGANSYTKAIGVLGPGNTMKYQIWYRYYASGVTTPTINANWIASPTNRLKVLAAANVTGIISTPLDVTASSSGTSTSSSTASGTLTQSNEIIFAGTFIDGGTSYVATANGFTNLINATNSSSERFTIDYQTVAATATKTHAPTWTGSTTYGSVLASFKGN